MNEFDHDFHLGRLLDDAAAEYRPVPDVLRLQRRLSTTRRRRGGVIMVGVAAGLALVGGSALAFKAQNEASRLQPAEYPPTVGTDKPDRPPFGTDKPTPTSEPAKDTSSTDKSVPPSSEPTSSDKVSPPAVTKPKTTEPPYTAPKTTEPTVPKTTDPTVPKPTVPETMAWTAKQVYGSCDTNPPFDVFHGTAKPGELIAIESAWGYAEGYADEDGNWEIRIEFPDSPVGEQFKVIVRYRGEMTKFWFTRLPAV